MRNTFYSTNLIFYIQAVNKKSVLNRKSRIQTQRDDKNRAGIQQDFYPFQNKHQIHQLASTNVVSF